MKPRLPPRRLYVHSLIHAPLGPSPLLYPTVWRQHHSAHYLKRGRPAPKEGRHRTLNGFKYY